MIVDYSNGEWLVEYTPRDNHLFKTIPGARFVRSKDRWAMPATLAAAWQLANAFSGELTKTSAAATELAGWTQWAGNQLNIKGGKDLRWASGLPEQLYDFQSTGVQFMVNGEQVLLADEMGTGKTVQTLVALQEMEAVPALIVCTKSMMHRWAAEVRTWTRYEPVVIEGSAAKRREIIETVGSESIAIINYEAVRLHSYCEGFGKHPKEGEPGELNGIGWLAVVADEAHKVKSPLAKQTRALWAVSRDAAYRYALTGTPVVNDPDDLWAIMHFVAPKEWPSRNRFRERYCHVMPGHFGGAENFGLRRAERPELDKFLEPRFLRRTKDEVLSQLPPKLHTTLSLPLTTKQRTAYNQMSKEMLADLEGEILLAPNPLSKLIRLRQIAGGIPTLDEEGRVTALTAPSNKLDALLDILEDHGPGVVVYAESRLLIEMLAAEIAKKMGLSIGLITGKISAEMRAINVEQFQAGDLDLIMGTVGAGAEGITLTRADTLVFAQRSWSNANNKQAEDRIHRIGQEANAANIITLVSEDTVDVAVETACELKETQLQEVCRDPAWLRKAIKGVR